MARKDELAAFLDEQRTSYVPLYWPQFARGAVFTIAYNRRAALHERFRAIDSLTSC